MLGFISECFHKTISNVFADPEEIRIVWTFVGAKFGAKKLVSAKIEEDICSIILQNDIPV